MGDSVVHDVPYFSQWASPELVDSIVSRRIKAAEDPRWSEYGATSPEEYEWWSWRLCGVACLRMALAFWKEYPLPSPMELAGECVESGAYVKKPDGLDGLIYAPFADYVRERWTIQAEVRPALTLSETSAQIADGKLVMLSVHPSIRDLDNQPLRRGGHLVLAVGRTPGQIVIHNPSGFNGRSQKFAQIPEEAFEPFYANRGVILGSENSSE
ncbi:C39 family peptidase [Streptomyces sp. BF23-18]|uniref:C39 family peptidase n=1 Tax=Streptomyces sp. BF23-18 TaxID=3240282 RepID=UPI0034E4B7C3